MKENPHPVKAQFVPSVDKIWRGLPAQLTGACRSTDWLFQKPNQSRLLPTSSSSWHSMSQAIWQLNATLPNEGSDRLVSIHVPIIIDGRLLNYIKACLWR